MNKKNLKTAMTIFASIFILSEMGLHSLRAQAADREQAGRQGQRMSQEKAISAQNGAPLYISPASVALVQQQLQQQGFDVQPIDGAWDRSTAQAVLNFQQQQGLDPTGNLNVETIQALGLQQVLEGTTERKFQTLPEQLAASEGVALYISPSNIRRIQQNLSQQGFYTGQVDAAWGPATREAIRKYEQEKGLQATGNVNLRLINTLGLSEMMAGLTGQTAPGQQQDQAARQDTAQQQQARGYYGQTGQTAGEGAPLFVSPLAIRQIQMALKQNGYDPGQIDGRWGRNTSQAVEQFQQTRALVPTGNLNITTARILLGGFELDSLPMGSSGSRQGRRNQHSQ